MKGSRVSTQERGNTQPSVVQLPSEHGRHHTSGPLQSPERQLLWVRRHTIRKMVFALPAKSLFLS